MSRSRQRSRTQQPPARKTGNESIPPATAQSHMDMLRKLAQIISSNFGVEVVFRGAEAHTDGKTIFVPSLSESAPQDLIEAIIGFVDHEVGHVMFTDMDYWMNDLNEEARTGDPRILKMTNAVEDVRQEHLMGLEYKGAGYNLDRTNEWALKRLTKQWNDPQVDSLFKFSVLLIAQAKAYEDVRCYSEFLDAHKAGFEGLLAAVDHEIRGFIHLKDVRASRDAAKRILDILDQMQDESESQQQKQNAQNEQQQGQGQACEDGESSDQPGQSSGQSAEGQADDSEQAKESSGGQQKDDADGDDDGDQAGQGADQAGDDADDGESAAGGQADDQRDGKADGDKADGDADSAADGDDGGDDADAGDDKPDYSKKGREQSPSLTPKEAKNLKNMRGASSGGFAEGGSMHEYIAGQIASDSGDAKGHRPYTTECDLVVPPVGDGTLYDYNRKLEEIRPAISVISKVLTRTLLAQSRSQTMRGRHSGRVSMNSLSQLRAKQTNIFEVTREGKKLDTFVQLIVDHSGSMHGRKMQVAEQTCIALSESLDKLGVPFAISGFTAGFGYDGGEAYEQKLDELMKARQDGRTDNYERVDPIVEFVYKTPQQRLAQARPALSLMTKQWKGCNADGDSIYQIAKRVAQRPEKRKLLIVLSDGYPAAGQGKNVPGDADERYMAHVAKALDNSKGFEIVGIGIMSDSVKNYYRRNFVVQSLNDLPQLAMTELRRVLLDKPDAQAA